MESIRKVKVNNCADCPFMKLTFNKLKINEGLITLGCRINQSKPALTSVFTLNNDAPIDIEGLNQLHEIETLIASNFKDCPLKQDKHLVCLE